MMRKVLAVIAIVAIVYFLVVGRSHKESEAPAPEPASVQTLEPSPVTAEQEADSKTNSISSSQPAEINADEKMAEGASRAFPEVLKSLGTCFDIRNQISADQIEPSVAQLVDSLRGELGDAVADYEDWSNEHVTLPNGEQRRLRLENSADANGVPGRYLRYFKIDREGLPEPILLPPEQTQNPSEEVLNSLRGEGKRSLFERSLRSYFQNGEEVMTVEKNGYITELDMAKGNKTFKCSNVNSPQPNCRCSEY